MKIFIMGIVASGKMTYAKELSKQTSLPFIELDSVVYRTVDDVRVKRSLDEQLKVIQEMDAAGSWIAEGVYRPSYHILLDMADVVIWLDPPLWKRKMRILSRHIKQVMGMEACAYEPNVQMLRNMYKWTKYFEVRRDKMNEILQPHRHKLLIVQNNPNNNKHLLEFSASI
ncbi:P-loop NTPase family protein [Sporosarcina sp. ITBMC105]